MKKPMIFNSSVLILISFFYSGCHVFFNGGLPPFEFRYFEGTALNPRSLIIYNSTAKECRVSEKHLTKETEYDLRGLKYDLNMAAPIDFIETSKATDIYINETPIVIPEEASLFYANETIRYGNNSYKHNVLVDYWGMRYSLSLIVFESEVYCIPSTLVVKIKDGERQIIHICEKNKTLFFQENFHFISKHQPLNFPIKIQKMKLEAELSRKE